MYITYIIFAALDVYMYRGSLISEFTLISKGNQVQRITIMFSLGSYIQYIYKEDYKLVYSGCLQQLDKSFSHKAEWRFCQHHIIYASVNKNWTKTLQHPSPAAKSAISPWKQ